MYQHISKRLSLSEVSDFTAVQILLAFIILLKASHNALKHGTVTMPLFFYVSFLAGFPGRFPLLSCIVFFTL